MAQGISQAELAEHAGLSEKTVSQLESGSRSAPYPRTVRLLSDALHLSAADRATLLAAARSATRSGVEDSSRTSAMIWPRPLTPLFGREHDIAAVCQQLRRPDVCLLSIIGPPGVGKTRLALEVAGAVHAQRTSRVIVVALADVPDPTFVLSAIATACNVSERGTQPLREALIARLRSAEHLLLLDNFEHLLPAAALVVDLLAACPDLTVLTTSREALQVRAEHVFALAPLPLPKLQPGQPEEALIEYAAVQLFVDRAQAVCPTLSLQSSDLLHIAAICHHLDGLPLAIELAAARVTLFTLPQLVERMQALLPLLKAPWRDAPARHQTLRAALTWSYELLSGAEQALFARLGVFAGGRTLDATAAICNAAGALALDVLDGIESLLDKNLLQREESMGSEPRFTMLETIHEYAREQLAARGEAEMLRDAHAAYFLALSEQAAQELTGPRQAAWLARLEIEHDNIRAALDWARERNQIDLGLRLAGALWRFWYARGHLSEGRHWLEGLLARAEADTGAHVGAAVRATALNGAGVLAYYQGDYQRATYLLETSLALWRQVGDKTGVAKLLNNVAMVAHHQGYSARAMTLYEESLRLHRELDDRWGIALSLGNLGVLTLDQGSYAQALALQHESLALAQQMGNQSGIAMSLGNLGILALQQGNYDQAAALLEESLALARSLGNQTGIATALISLGRIAVKQGDGGCAVTRYRESLALCREMGDRASIAECLEGLAAVIGARGDAEQAARLLGAAAALRAAIDAASEVADHSLHERTVATAQAVLGHERFETALAGGRALSLSQAISEALAL